jgi:hypothetical protein
VSAEIITFSRPQRPRREAAERQPHDFWVPLLEDMAPAQRRATIEAACVHGVIASDDREIFLTSWLDQEGAA